MENKKRIIIIGGGFAGLNLAKGLDKRYWDVVIVDRHNYHSFPPLFYQVASSGLEPASISFPLRREMRSRRMKGCRFHYGDVKEIRVDTHEVVTQYETLRYDALAIAAGTTNNFFGIDGLRERVLTIKSIPEAIRTRNLILDRLERAAICTEEDERRALLTFVVVGGGPAGVEIAGALGEMKRFILAREYPSVDAEEMRVVLVEASDALLKSMGARSSSDALSALEEMPVEVKLGKVVKNYDGFNVSFADGENIRTETVIWTAGITGVPFRITGAEIAYGPGHRFCVDEFNRIDGLDDVYAIGDISFHADETFPHGCPQVAQVAIQQGRCLARNLNSATFIRPFSYNDKGTMATIGRNRAVVDIGKRHMSGFIAWIAWMFVHLISLLGMKNKTVVLLNWIWSYFTFSSGLRLILRPSRFPVKSDSEV